MATFMLDVEGEVAAELTPMLRQLWGLRDDATHARLAEFLERIHPEDRRRVAEARSLAMRAREPYNLEYRMVRDDGEIRYIRTQGQFFFDEHAGVLRNIGVVVDITEHLLAASALEGLLEFDHLTGLLDRRAFTRLVRERGEDAGDDDAFCVIVFDLHGFGDVNEAHGMAAGDDVLREAARRLRERAVAGAAFARIGSDEFAALVPVGSEGTSDAIARVTSLFDEPFSVAGADIPIDAVFGVSVCPFDGADESLILKASLAMTEATGSAPRRVSRYRPEMQRLIAERRLMALSLRGALERDEFEMYFQPIAEARGLQITGAEALLRWNHPDLGVIPPGIFLPAAEEAGLMKDVDLWALRHASRVAKDLFARGLRVGINVSAHLLLSNEFPAAFEEVLSIPGAREHLCFEITEQALLADRAQARSAIGLIRDSGVRIALDDFGTGYNTLSYLKLYPIDVVKIDRTFTSDLEQYQYSRSLCSGILALASRLGLYVVAEGVETKAQEQFLRAHGCHALQGHLYGRPMPRDDFLQLAA